ERAWRDDRPKLVAEGRQVVAALKAGDASGAEAPSGNPDEAGAEALRRCFRHFRESFDPARGGFGGAPKFPRAAALTFLFRCAAWEGASPDARRDAAAMAAATL